jgi:hypothetical protein
MIHEYSPANPRRPVDWRWQRAALAASGEAPLARKGGDRWVGKALAFQRRQAEARDMSALAELAETEPAIFWAHDLRYSEDLMIDQSIGHAYPERPSDLKHFVADVTQNDLRRQAMLALKTLRINNFNAMEVVDKFLKLVEIERTTGGAGGLAGEALKQNVEAMMISLPFAVGSRVSNIDVPELDQYDSRGVELRFEEVMAVSVGQDFPARQMVEQLAFPPPPLLASTDGEGNDG